MVDTGRMEQKSQDGQAFSWRPTRTGWRVHDAIREWKGKAKDGSFDLTMSQLFLGRSLLVGKGMPVSGCTPVCPVLIPASGLTWARSCPSSRRGQSIPQVRKRPSRSMNGRTNLIFFGQPAALASLMTLLKHGAREIGPVLVARQSSWPKFACATP